jgi:hypothetical protein
MLLLAIWLILYGAIPLLGIDLGKLSIVMPILAIVAGVLLLLKR